MKIQRESDGVFRSRDELWVTGAGWAQHLIKLPLSDFETQPKSGDKVTFSQVFMNGTPMKPTLTVLADNFADVLCQVES